MSSTISVSKGVFSFKRSKNKRTEAKTMYYWPGDSVQWRNNTYSRYRECLEIVTGITENLQRKIHSKVFTELVQFIKTSYDCNVQNPLQREDIPTACLLTGVNMPDHNAIFGSIAEMVTTSVGPHVSRLQSQECSTVRSAVFKMVSQLMKRSANYTFDPMEDDDDGPSVKRAQCTMAVLSSWYQRQVTNKRDTSFTEICASPSKGKGKKRTTMKSPSKSHSPVKKVKLEEDNNRKPVVIIFEDAENFPSHVLQDLILICREYVRSIPFVFVFGVATTSSAVHRSLSQDASSCLSMETFQAQPSTHYLSEIIEEVLMFRNVPFHLGGRTFKLLLDIFLYNDLSVRNYNKALQVCMIEHFSSNPASFLCCLPDTRKKVMQKVDSAELDAIRKLPSFRTYVESCPAKDRAALLLDQEFTKNRVLSLLEELELHYSRFSVLVKVVALVIKKLPQSPLGRQVREVLATCLSRSLVKTDEYHEVQKMLKHLSKEEILLILKNVVELLEVDGEGDEPLDDFRCSLLSVKDQLNNLDQVCQVEESTSDDAPFTLQAKDRYQLKEKLKELAMKTKKSKPFEEARSQLLMILDTMFEKHLFPPIKLPLHEILFFDSSTVIKKQLIGMARPALTTALSNPHHYLQCECCVLDEPSNIVTSLPDVSVAYKLHLECGRLINLYDWLQAFVSVIDQEADAGSRKIDKAYQARFVQAILELQFLGFIKQTKRKTDHVARLTWGGC